MKLTEKTIWFVVTDAKGKATSGEFDGYKTAEATAWKQAQRTKKTRQVRRVEILGQVKGEE